MALRVGQVGTFESRASGRARDVEAQMTEKERLLVSVRWIARVRGDLVQSHAGWPRAWGRRRVKGSGRMPHTRRFRLARFRSAVLVLALVGAWLTPVAIPPTALGAQGSVIFNYTGRMQTWKVPAGVHRAFFDVRGAQGGGNDVFLLPIIQGGKGGRTLAEVRVVPGEVIHIFVGGKGGDGGPAPTGPSPLHLPRNPVGASTAGVRAAGVATGGLAEGAAAERPTSASMARTRLTASSSPVVAAVRRRSSTRRAGCPTVVVVVDSTEATGAPRCRAASGGLAAPRPAAGVRLTTPRAAEPWDSEEMASCPHSSQPAAAVAVVATTAAAVVGSGPAVAAGAGSGREWISRPSSSIPARTKATGVS